VPWWSDLVHAGGESIARHGGGGGKQIKEGGGKTEKKWRVRNGYGELKATVYPAGCHGTGILRGAGMRSLGWKGGAGKKKE